MTLLQWITSLAVVAVTAGPALAQDNAHQRRENRQSQQTEEPRREQAQPRQQQTQPPQAQPRQQQTQPQQAQPRQQQTQPQQAQPRQQATSTPPQRQYERAVPRAVEPQREGVRREDVQRRNDQAWRGDGQRRNDQAWRGDGQRRNDEQVRRDVAVPRAFPGNRAYVGNDIHRWDGGRYGEPLHYGYGYRPRIIRPTIIQVAPYRPYIYRPNWSIGVYYGYDDYYPYGYTPEGYFDPMPGHYYGGVRITGAPRDARVFADGYFVGIVDDFDGIFQHMNLEAGPHHIEIQWGASQPVAFDVNVRPGETITFRADPSMFQPY